MNKRRLLCERVLVEGRTLAEASRGRRGRVRCARKWVGRYLAEGERVCSIAPRRRARVANRTPEQRVEAIACLRRLGSRAPGIAEPARDGAVDRPSRLLTRSACRHVFARAGGSASSSLRARAARPSSSRRRQEARPHPARRRQASAGPQPRSLRATDALGSRRGHGALGLRPHRDPRLHPARLRRVPTDERATTAIAFLRRAVAFFDRHGVKVERLLTDNGSPYRSTVHAIACRALSIRHLRTRPYRPQTNGKAERFIRTLLGGWAYGAVYRNSTERSAALDGWLWHYNHHRKHSALGAHSPRAPASTSEPTCSGPTTSRRLRASRRPGPLTAGAAPGGGASHVRTGSE